MSTAARLPRLAACIAATLITVTAHADAMSCGQKLVSDGDSMYDVQTRCGAPDMTYQRVEYRTIVNHVNGPCFRQQNVWRCGYDVAQSVPVVIDEWTYDFGPHQFVRTLVFEQGVLRAVRTGHYGQKH